ncbi:uncharacterized protein LOC135368398 isoform X2 [Ornithodoros turicata]|uniref:uncharacterized protein LOC135368398 isoform X2 n=1 Tax=Ornithodoros turicata TaxID=34597 RepID=UPI00313A1544
MGKVRKNRQICHQSSAPQVPRHENTEAPNISAAVNDIDASEGLSMVSSKQDVKHMTKREKTMMKREAFKKKLAATKPVKMKAKQRRKPTWLTLTSLQDALPTLESLCRKKKKQPAKEKPRASKSFRTNQKLLLQDMNDMERIANTEYFKADPLKSVLTHLRFVIQQQSSEGGKE